FSAASRFPPATSPRALVSLSLHERIAWCVRRGAQLAPPFPFPLAELLGPQHTRASTAHLTPRSSPPWTLGRYRRGTAPGRPRPVLLPNGAQTVNRGRPGRDREQPRRAGRGAGAGRRRGPRRAEAVKGTGALSVFSDHGRTHRILAHRHRSGRDAAARRRHPVRPD